MFIEVNFIYWFLNETLLVRVYIHFGMHENY